MTDTLLYDERRLFEAYNKGLSLLPTHELPWFRQTWDRAHERYGNGVFVEHSALVDELLGRITAEGPLSVIDFEARPPIEWHWRPTNAVRALLEGLAEGGVLALVRRQGNRRYYDLAERLFPPDLLADHRVAYEQRRHRLLSRFRGHGLLGRTGSAELWSGTAPAVRKPTYDGPLRGELIDDLVLGSVLVPVAVEGVRGTRYVLAEEVHDLERAEGDAADLPAGHRIGEGPSTPLDPDSAGVAFLAPLDPLVWDREFLRSLFDFDYLLEVYIPVRRRQWGYYVLPILWGDRLVGRYRAARRSRIGRDPRGRHLVGAGLRPPHGRVHPGSRRRPGGASRIRGGRARAAPADGVWPPRSELRSPARCPPSGDPPHVGWGLACAACPPAWDDRPDLANSRRAPGSQRGRKAEERIDGDHAAGTGDVERQSRRGQRDGRVRHERRVPGDANHLEGTHGRVGRSHEPGGAARCSACRVLLDGLLERGLSKAGFVPDRVGTTASILFRKLDAWTVFSSTLDVRAKVPGIGKEQFLEIAELAKETCPISRAIKGNVQLAVNATLEQ